jgi:hypothetical protein
MDTTLREEIELIQVTLPTPRELDTIKVEQWRVEKTAALFSTVLQSLKMEEYDLEVLREKFFRKEISEEELNTYYSLDEQAKQQNAKIDALIKELKGNNYVSIL